MIVPLLDEDWDDDGYDLQRGAGAVSIYDIFPFTGGGHGSWEAAEKHARNAIRSGAVFLSDYDIARRLPARELRKQGWAETQAEWKARAKELEAQKAEERAARAEAQRLAQQRSEERARYDALWYERYRILGSRWRCPCGGSVRPRPDGDGYRLTCNLCGKTAWASHAKINGII